mmetsp:Transcript_24053/g.26571  ORF Transcript_24053/g.26571 Transcript_24053/m.26571 type:complete len:275 (-) Transcript_24053:310-1134(-)|eukprot:CAMPEP_0194145898 /NCGR_PEP_ID=MMETSP0152-20130528/18903_1 /TAXON_ID=1049557 /ORGANISM="Thalassiothrix antarctica, Strain L6-D1" /LENGTH=274 /DNA_ID=CAMNT_0038846267 /DNA_START=137 /DNA_END=961 /DNA_ORIENTATION=+
MARRSKVKAAVEAESDPSAWILENDLAQFLLMHTTEIKYMCMFGYTYLHGCKVFGKTSTASSSTSYKFISMVLACTGGGILVPIFINSIPVPLCTDAYPIAILVSTMLHMAFPIVREVVGLSAIVKTVFMMLYEIMRAFVVVKLTTAAGAAIPASDFDFAVFGPIFCGTLAGCGGAFLPLDKGLTPIKENGLAPNMVSACVAATSYHLFMNLYSDGIQNADKKAHVCIAAFFIIFGLVNEFKLLSFTNNNDSTSSPAAVVKEEGKKKEESKKTK